MSAEAESILKFDPRKRDEHVALALSDICSAHRALRPPKRVSVAEGAAGALVIKQPGGSSTSWSAEMTPYMVEPMNMLASRQHEAVVFVGPARTGKTEGLILGWGAHAIVNDPGDMLVVQMNQEKAREFSKTSIARALRNSPELAALQSPSAKDDNTHDKMFRHGMWLRIGWPTVPNLSGSTYRYVALTDYDRMPDDIGGEGEAFALALKRIQTFLSRGKCLAESSPGRPINDPKWRPATKHEAPPTGGILGLYNRSDRRRWYWKCPDCRDHFEASPGIDLFGLPAQQQLLEIVREADIDELSGRYNRVICPHCGSIIEPKWKKHLNATGRWLQDGLIITPDDEIIGTPMVSTIAGYWLGGAAAAFQPWRSIVGRYLQALRTFALTGDELALQVTTNTDQGAAYMSRHLAEIKAAEVRPQDRADDTLERYVVPEWARFILAAVDVQGGVGARFEVQVHAVGPFGMQQPIDRFYINASTREGMGGAAPIDPAGYAEDWDQITEQVLRKTYRTAIEGLELRPHLVAIDTGGEDGVSANAYDYYRRLRRQRMHRQVMMVKGNNYSEANLKTATSPIKETMLGKIGDRGVNDVPVYLLNTNALKDMVANGMKRQTPGPTFYAIPGWLPPVWFDELFAEVRQANGLWKKIRKRNETLDLCAYIWAAYLRAGADKIKDWLNAPSYALPPGQGNLNEILAEDRRDYQDNAPVAAAVEQPARVVRPMRRAAASPYLT